MTFEELLEILDGFDVSVGYIARKNLYSITAKKNEWFDDGIKIRSLPMGEGHTIQAAYDELKWAIEVAEKASTAPARPEMRR